MESDYQEYPRSEPCFCYVCGEKMPEPQSCETPICDDCFENLSGEDIEAALWSQK